MNDQYGFKELYQAFYDFFFGLYTSLKWFTIYILWPIIKLLAYAIHYIIRYIAPLVVIVWGVLMVTKTIKETKGCSCQHH